MSTNKSTRIPPMVGNAIFEAGASTETVEFSSIAATGEAAIEPAKLVPPMLARFMATDRAFAKLRRTRSKQSA